MRNLLYLRIRANQLIINAPQRIQTHSKTEQKLNTIEQYIQHFQMTETFRRYLRASKAIVLDKCSDILDQQINNYSIFPSFAIKFSCIQMQDMYVVLHDVQYVSMNIYSMVKPNSSGVFLHQLRHVNFSLPYKRFPVYIPYMGKFWRGKILAYRLIIIARQKR